MKKILYVVLGLGIVYLILCLFGPSNVKVERTIDVKAPKELVMSKLLDSKFFHNEWSPWTELDPKMKVTYTGEEGKVGFSYAWESDNENVGKGSMTLDKITSDSIVETLRFEGMGESTVYNFVKVNGENTTIVWGMMFDVGFFGRAPMLFMNMDKMLGADYEKGLAKLKPAIEKLTTAAPIVNYDIKEINWEARTYLGKKGKFKFPEIAGFFSQTYPALGGFLATNKVELLSAPSAIYFTFDEKAMETECAAVFSIKDNNKKMEDWERFQVPASKVLLIEYYGAYDKSAQAHYAIDAYIKEKGLAQSFVIEEYVTDPMMEKDTSKWLTNIFYVIK